ncbi:MAG: protease-4 [Myxococcota bacterium]|jgi:protease-4
MVTRHRLGWATRGKHARKLTKTEPRMRRQILALSTTLAAVFTTALGASAAPPGDSPRGFIVPWNQAPELEGVESTLGHAAGLGFLEGAELGLGITTRLSGDGPVNAFTGMAAGRLGPIALGLAFGGIGDGPGSDSTTTRFDVALALRLSAQISLGFHWHGLYSDVDPALDEYDSWDVSATLRPLRALAISLGLERFDNPDLGATALDPILRLGIGIRPGTERITLGLEASRLMADDGIWTVGGSARAMVVPGFSLGAYGRYQFAESGPVPDMVQFGGFLGLAQGSLGFESSLDVQDVEGHSASSLAMLLRASTARKPSLVTRSNVVLKLPIRGPIAERSEETLFGSGGATFGQYLQALDIIGRDPTISGLLIQIERAPSWGQCWELRAAFKRLQDKGKRIHAVMTVGDMKAMYLASAADKVHLYAAGGLMLTGLSITRSYYLGLLEKLGVKAEIVKWQDYKSAPEAMTQSGSSAAARKQTQALLDGVDAGWMSAVGQGRGLTRETLRGILADGPQTMHMALSAKLVDGLVEEEELRAALRADFGADMRVSERYKPARESWQRWGGRKAIAIIPVVGSIVDGSSAGALPIPILGSASTGAGTFVRAIRQASGDPNVVGIVVRVDSGGGSAIASDKMHRAVVDAAKLKPVIVSFGNIAASGGYYLAAGAPKIIATPMTVTGSIGIFSGKADISGLYTMLGVNTETIKTLPNADMMDSHRPWTEAERERAKLRLKSYYDRFVSLVAKGRSLPMETAYDVARGRVYLGEAAKALKLTDAEGGLWDAVEEIRTQAGIGVDEPLDLRYLGGLEALSSLQRLAAQALDLTGMAKVDPTPLSPSAKRLGQLLTVLTTVDGGAPLALMPYTLSIE